MPPSVKARITFWQRLHERLPKLSNRVDAVTQGKILSDIHARIPMVTLEEQHALKLANAKADERFWTSMRDMSQDQVEGHKGIITTAERAVAEGQAAAAAAATKATAAKDRIDRLKRGEDVPGGLNKPLTQDDFERILREQGFTTSDFQHMDRLVELHKMGDNVWKEFLRELHKDQERARKATSRRVLSNKLIMRALGHTD